MKNILTALLLVLCLGQGACLHNINGATAKTVFETMAKIVNIADGALRTAYAIRGPAIRKSQGFQDAARSCPDQCGIEAAVAFYDVEIKKYDQARDAVTGARAALDAITKALTVEKKPVDQAVAEGIDTVVGTVQSVKGLAGVTIPPELNTTLSATCIVVKSISTKPTKCTVVEGGR